MGNTSKTNVVADETEGTVEVPKQTGAPEAEVIDLQEHLPVSLSTKIKKLVKNKKVLSVAGGVVLGVVAAVVINGRRQTDTEQVEDESASA